MNSQLMSADKIKTILKKYGFTQGGFWYVMKKSVRMPHPTTYYASIGSLPYLPEGKFAVCMWPSAHTTSGTMLEDANGDSVFMCEDNLINALEHHFNKPVAIEHPAQ